MTPEEQEQEDAKRRLIQIMGDFEAQLDSLDRRAREADKGIRRVLTIAACLAITAVVIVINMLWIDSPPLTITSVVMTTALSLAALREHALALRATRRFRPLLMRERLTGLALLGLNILLVTSATRDVIRFIGGDA
jgi:Flp pilus assembly protein TadB